MDINVENDQNIMDDNELPVLPLRDVVVYPHMVIPLFVGRRRSIKALEIAMLSNNKQIFLVAQKSSGEDEPNQESIFHIGTTSSILQLLKLPDGTVKVLIEGLTRGKADKFISHDDYLSAIVNAYPTNSDNLREIEILARSVFKQFDHYIKLNKKIPPEILISITSIEDPTRLVDTITAHLSLKISEKQEILEEQNLRCRLEKLMGFLDTELDMLQVEKRITGRVKRQIEKTQREYYLNEKMRAIQKELGESQDIPDEIEKFTKRIAQAGMTKEAKTKALAELDKLKIMSHMSAEATVSRNFLDCLLNVPWKKRSKVHYNLIEAQKILDADHYGLEKVKERIIEYLAVQQRVMELKGPILCLVGPPGVGKTSLGKSIAKATGRIFVRMSLGGMRDEAEIRGHRRTYIGSMPGKIIQNFSKAGVKNPLFLLDEIDKMAMDFRGDPASALLEVLDPEQNSTFNDHYLEVGYNLSEAMFIATANIRNNIPNPLLDRMEIINLPGYTEDEKIHIALRHLIPKQLIANGLKPKELVITESAVKEIVRYYTREAGVRGLERDISKICRKIVKSILLKSPSKTITVSHSNIERYLGVKRFRYGLAEEHDQIGQVTGLAWTEVGGELLTIEAAAIPGKGKTIYTGHLGEVMRESIQAALTVVRSRTDKFSIAKDFYEKNDIHVHVPEGATPKDGPSAGIGMCTALVSVLTKIPVRADVAMTGEITLRGEILPIGGLKEKLLAAQRGGIRLVLIPEENRRDLKEIPKNIKQGLNIYPVKWIDQVLELALQRMPDSGHEDIEVKLANAAISVQQSNDQLDPTTGHISTH